jgi:beta-galactosidase
VAFEIVDAAGSVVPTAGNLVHVTVTGGELVVLDNADLQDHDGYRAGQRHAFNGRGLAIVRGMRPGALRVDASADGLRPASITLRVVAGRATPSIPAAR